MLVRTRSRSSFDQSFDQLTRSFFAPVAKRTPTVDAAWTDGTLVLTVDLPGVPAEAVEVSVAGRQLTIAANTEQLSWERTMRLGTALDPEQVTAQHVDGRLTVFVGAVPAAETRRIEVSTATPAIEAEATAAAQDGEGTETSDSEG
jgi:HSP20 family molecular chaperone IbpA